MHSLSPALSQRDRAAKESTLYLFSSLALGHAAVLPRAPMVGASEVFSFLIPTLCVGMQPGTLQRPVWCGKAWCNREYAPLERRRMHYHAERGNENQKKEP